MNDGMFPKIKQNFRKTNVRLQYNNHNNFWQQNVFLTCSWRFLISKKIIGIEKHAGKVRKCPLLNEKIKKETDRERKKYLL